MKIVGMISAFNEEDIIEECINHHLSQGIDLVVLDTGSTDSTFEICKKFSDNQKIKLFQIKSTKWDLPLNLSMTYHLALRESPDWIFHIDADEFFESGQDSIDLKSAIEKVDREGFNLIQFDRFDFFMTENDNKNLESVLKKFLYYSYGGDSFYRAWKFFPGVRNDFQDGAFPIFPEVHKYKIFPTKLVCRHYQFRTKEQGMKKIQERLSKLKNMPDMELGINFHYQKRIDSNFQFLVNHNSLLKYNEDNTWNTKNKPKHETYRPSKNPEDKNRYEMYEPPSKTDLVAEDGTLKMRPRTYNEILLDSIDQGERFKKESICKRRINFQRRK